MHVDDPDEMPEEEPDYPPPPVQSTQPEPPAPAPASPAAPAGPAATSPRPRPGPPAASPAPRPEDAAALAALNGRQPPHSLEAEQAVLGGILLSPNGYDQVEGKVAPDDFYSPAYGCVFEAMSQLSRRGQPMDTLLLKEELERKGHLDLIGGVPGLAALMDAVPSGAQVPYYAQIVREKAILRRLISAAAQIVESAGAASDEPSAILDEAEHAIFEVATRGMTKEAAVIQEVLRETWAKLDMYQRQAKDGHGIITGLPTGYHELDNYLSGLHEDELIIIAGRPSMGKSTFALNVLRHVGVEQEQAAVIYTLEMSSENIARNLLCAHGRIDAQRLRTGILKSEEWTHIGMSTDALSQAKIFIDDTPAISLSEIRGKTRRLKARHDVKLCVIDYLQLITASSSARGRSREQEISEISRGLKALAKELKIPIIALAQLNRKAEGRTDNRPILSDLRESGAIEQDADVVLLLHRPEYYDKEDRPGQAEVIIAKQRNGPTGTVSLTFLGNQLRFENLAADSGRAYTPGEADDEY